MSIRKQEGMTFLCFFFFYCNREIEREEIWQLRKNKEKSEDTEEREEKTRDWLL